MKEKKQAQRSLQMKDFEEEYRLMPCIAHPTLIRNLTEKTKAFLKEHQLTEDKYFEIYTKLAKRNTQESKEYLKSCGFEDSENLLVYFNK